MRSIDCPAQCLFSLKSYMAPKENIFQQITRQRNKGDRTEIHAYNSIMRAKFVQKIEPTIQNEWYDFDFSISVPLFPIQVFKLEIKSSKKGLDDFHSKIADMHTIALSDVEYWMMQHAVVVLIASEKLVSTDDIIWNLFEAITKVEEYYGIGTDTIEWARNQYV